MTSSASNTNSTDTPVKFVKGVGPALGGLFASRGIFTVRDLLQFLPRAYQDRTQLGSISQVIEGELITLSGSITTARKVHMRGMRGKSFLEAKFQDDTGTVNLKWFHVPYGLEARIRVGAQLIITGKPKEYRGSYEFIHPEISFGGAVNGATEAHFGRVVPIYSEIEGIKTRVLRKIIWNALEKFGMNLSDDIPVMMLKKHGLGRAAEAVKYLHFPRETNDFDMDAYNRFATPHHQRLIFDELFKFEYLVLQSKVDSQKDLAFQHDYISALKNVSDLKNALPFELTQDQRKVLTEILNDLSQSYPMNRLIQGDVGSGKTAVVFLAAGAVLADGKQAALMAPTEILAEQHYKNAIRFFGSKLNVYLLTGRSTQRERDRIVGRLSAGEPALLIGTHALIEDPVRFKNLTLACIDEQHRFGVEQRKKLSEKGSADGKKPHRLVLSATPIPRTLALTVYGDLSISTIKEKPPGRQKIVTRVSGERGRKEVYDFIRTEIRKGRQAYFIFPLVDESEAEGFTDLKSAIVESERLDSEIFPEFRVALLHGRMSSDEKSKIMDEFKRGESQILVSTTVVEVGVDVPNSTIILIEHADRFGLSQLHQLRGRVGRGEHESFCFLMSGSRSSELSKERLKALEKTDDGFEIAQIDLEMRGPGEFMGTRQSGDLPFRIADIVRDQHWVQIARDEAEKLIKDDPELFRAENQGFARYLKREGRRHKSWLETS